jgi:excisionase family DNA binding protein
VTAEADSASWRGDERIDHSDEPEEFGRFARLREILSLPGDPWLTLEQASDYTQFSRETLRKCADDGELRGIKKSSQWRFRRSWLDTWLETALVVAALLGVSLSLSLSLALALAPSLPGLPVW